MPAISHERVNRIADHRAAVAGRPEVTLGIPAEHLKAVRFWACRELRIAAESVLDRIDAEQHDCHAWLRELGAAERDYARLRRIVAQLGSVASESAGEACISADRGSLAEILRIVIDATGDDVDRLRWGAWPKEAGEEAGDRRAYFDELRLLVDRLSWAVEKLEWLEESQSDATS